MDKPELRDIKIWEEKRMIVVGQVSTPEEKKEIELIVSIFVVGNRARTLALRSHEPHTNRGKKKSKQTARVNKFRPISIIYDVK